MLKFHGQLLKNESLAQYTSWRTGGCADVVYLPANLEDLSNYLHYLDENIPVTWLGLGSNTLVRDGGVEGVVIVTQGCLKQLSQIGFHEIRAEAGVASAQLARYCARLGGEGLEFMAGIPGTVGGALAMNAGCFGGETWDFVQRVETINRRGEIKKRPKDDFTIHYRHVRYAEQAMPQQEEWFIAGYFSFHWGHKEKALEKIRDLLNQRHQTQPMGTANCGSVFRNPEGDYAGRLIEQCGLKGKRLGGAEVSKKHANFILNEHQASAKEIEALIEEVGAIVEQKTGVRLVKEVRIIGRIEK